MYSAKSTRNTNTCAAHKNTPSGDAACLAGDRLVPRSITMENESQTESKPQIPLTPMLVQYLELKRNYPDSILFYRMGDFYEMFFDDALKAAPVLEVQLTSRDRSAANPIPMCGVPYHAVTQYLQKLLNRGFKVAICEQMEDPSLAKGIVRRDVVRVVTPALIGDPELVPEETKNWLACVSSCATAANSKSPFAEVSLLDLLGGEVRSGVVNSLRELIDLFTQTLPKELLIANDDSNWTPHLEREFPQMVITRRAPYFENADPLQPKSLTAIKKYLGETQKRSDLPHWRDPQPLSDAHSMAIDPTTSASLEILRSNSGPEGPTLFRVLDFTLTPMGRRTLKEWLCSPLGDLSEIQARHEVVAEFISKEGLSEKVRETLAPIRDLERLTTKTSLGLAMPRDLVAIREILKKLPALKETIHKSKAKRLKRISAEIDCLASLAKTMEEALEDVAPSTLREGGIFRSQYHPEIKEYRELSHDAKSTIAGIETREKARTGIPSLKLKYSRVFGYTIEITKAYLSKVPPEYIRKQTIANGERFITEEIKTFEEKVVSAEYRLKILEESLFVELRESVATQASCLLHNAKLIGELDVLLSFAEAAKTRAYCKPRMIGEGALEIQDGRHPVVETLLPVGQFVPNSITLADECRTMVITGPNMGGKSTIMRQAALIAIMAHAGSFVPATSAVIPLIDAIYTRIGSSDDLARGRSTFMVEMTEVARIVERATPRSLILIDEIGRGTSTYDGLSLAWSLLEFIHNDVRAKTLFATHFHELTLLENSLPGLRNGNVLVEKWRDEIVFLYRLAPGICNQSYGIEVAKLAGLPQKVLLRARDLLSLLETQSQRGTRARNRALEIHDNQMAFFDESKRSESRTELET